MARLTGAIFGGGAGAIVAWLAGDGLSAEVAIAVGLLAVIGAYLGDLSGSYSP